MTDLDRRMTLKTLAAGTLGAAGLAAGAAAQAPAGGPLAGGPLAGAAAGPFATQPWGAENRLAGPGFAVERVAFRSGDAELIGNLFVPDGPGRKAAVAILGPVAFVKEQAPLQYALRLVREGFAALIFDPTGHGESEGEPRRDESGTKKVADLRAALGFLASRADIDPDRLHLLGVCQGVNWTIETALVEPRARSIALVAGHYLTPEVAVMYLGSPQAVEARIAKGLAAAERFRATGAVDYIRIVSPSLAEPDPAALLTAPPIHMFYIRWADRSPFLAHRGLWENRITAMSEAAIWGHRIDRAMPRLTTPTLMVHADRAASGGPIPRALFAAMPAARKELVWLGGQGQLMFYEDPITIDMAAAPVARFFKATA